MPKQKAQKALIAGATGVVGRNLLKHLLATGEWEVVTLSRRKPDIDGPYEHISIDLLDAAQCQAKLSHLSDITHVFYVAVATNPDPLSPAIINSNLAMLRNVVENIEPVAAGLQHIHFMQGTKWYGSHLGGFKTPAREDHPRHMPPNFYYNQWDYMAERQKGKRWTYSSSRPHAICGFAIGNHSNLTMVIGIYAAISKELGLPLCHPGTADNHHALYQCTDSSMLARAVVWMSTAPQCANQAFNITNGDLIRWEDTWPKIAKHFHMETGMRRNISLVRTMADKAPVWEQMVQKYGLRNISYADIVQWPYGDFVFAADFDVVSSLTKLRRFGFHEQVDTEDMFFRMWDEMRAEHILPPVV